MSWELLPETLCRHHHHVHYRRRRHPHRSLLPLSLCFSPRLSFSSHFHQTNSIWRHFRACVVAMRRCNHGSSFTRVSVIFSFLRYTCDAKTTTYFQAQNTSGTAERICAKFTGKTCLVRRSEEFECQGQRLKIKVNRHKKGKRRNHAASDRTNVSGMAKRMCAKFTGKTCLVPLSDQFECEGQMSKVKVTRDKKRAMNSRHSPAVCEW